MDLTSIVFLAGVGLLGGAWNAIAGGATLFTFPALMIAGLPPIIANATNYLAMLPSNAAAIPAYWRELTDVGRGLWPLLVVSGAGAIVGALLLLESQQALFEELIPWLIFAATILFAFGQRISLAMRKMLSGRWTSTSTYILLFLFSIYGGYFGAGLGIILLAVVQILGFRSFHTANALKNLLATSFTLLSIGIFGLGGIIAWPQAITMMLGSSVGGYLGGRYARSVNEVRLRGFVILFGVALSLFYLIRVVD